MADQVAQVVWQAMAVWEARADFSCPRVEWEERPAERQVREVVAGCRVGPFVAMA